jgi:GNAT superfamily N-acetyltransferase
VFLRQIVTDDVPAVAELIVAAWQAAYRGIIPDEMLDGMSAPEIAAAWRQILAEGHRTVLVAEADGKVCGFVGFGKARDDDLDPVQVAEVYGIYVHPAWWGRGAGRALFEAAIVWLRENGYLYLVLWTMRDNARAREFYERMGLTWDGRQKESTRGQARFGEVRYRIVIEKEASGEQVHV